MATIGVDLGTSSVKMVLRGADGSVRGRSRQSYPLYTSAEGAAEQAPSDWWRAVRRAARDLAPALAAVGEPLTGVAAVGQIPTAVFLDERGSPLGRAVTWLDGRADPLVARLLDGAGRQRTYRITGMPPDGRYLGPMFLRWRRDHPRKARRMARLVAAKDWLSGCLGAGPFTDPSTATGYLAYDLERQDWDDALVALWGLRREMLPTVVPSGRAVGRLSGEAGRQLGWPEGLPLVCGAADSVAAALAAGATPGDLVVVEGSSTVLMAISPHRPEDPEGRVLATPLATGEGWGAELDLLSTGAAYRWLERLLALPEGRPEQPSWLALALEAPPGAGGVRVHPHLAGGEQAGLQDSALRGRIEGLTLRTGRAELARGLVEGVLGEMARCADYLQRVAGPLKAAVWLSPWSGSGSYRRLLEEALGLPVRLPPAGADSAVGAAILAAAPPGPPG